MILKRLVFLISAPLRCVAPNSPTLLLLNEDCEEGLGEVVLVVFVAGFFNFYPDHFSVSDLDYRISPGLALLFLMIKSSNGLRQRPAFHRPLLSFIW